MLWQSLRVVVITTRAINTHYQSQYSPLAHSVLTTGRCSHDQINEFSLPVAVLTTRSMNSHYRSLFSLPSQWTLTNYCRSLFSLPDQWIHTTGRCSQIKEFSLPTAVRTIWQINEFSLPIAVLTTRSKHSHSLMLVSLPTQSILSLFCTSHSLLNDFSLTHSCRCSHKQIN